MTRDIDALVAFINERQAKPYAWGREANDCFGYVLSAAKVQTGHDRATKYRWKTQKGALKVIARIRREYGSVEAALDHFFQRIPPAKAMRGDIAGVPDETFGIHPMIVEGGTLVGPGDKGNRRLKRQAMICAWSVVQ